MPGFNPGIPSFRMASHPSESSEQDDPLLIEPEWTQLLWFVAHCRPRSEKKLAEFCVEQGYEHRLPVYRSVKTYVRKRVVFEKPLFPGYLFARVEKRHRQMLVQNRYVANLLDVHDQAEFAGQLDDIYRALDAQVEIQVCPEIKAGLQVRIKSGPLRGMEAWVESRAKMSDVHLRLDFIGQAVVAKIQADDLELI
jgi:transcription antitermination factor NusG